jgi:hypothetical protein
MVLEGFSKTQIVLYLKVTILTLKKVDPSKKHKKCLLVFSSDNVAFFQTSRTWNEGKHILLKFLGLLWF